MTAPKNHPHSLMRGVRLCSKDYALALMGRGGEGPLPKVFRQPIHARRVLVASKSTFVKHMEWGGGGPPPLGARTSLYVIVRWRIGAREPKLLRFRSCGSVVCCLEQSSPASVRAGKFGWLESPFQPSYTVRRMWCRQFIAYYGDVPSNELSLKTRR